MIPVILGSDSNVYGMARSFHQQYNVKSVAISKMIRSTTANSKIIDFVLNPNLETDDGFVNTLVDFAKKHPDETLVLVPCSDGYVSLLVKHREVLKQYYKFNCPSQEVIDLLTYKDSFYEVCDKYGFSYPKTQVVDSSHKASDITIEFPVIIKASNSVEYWKCDFNGKMKVFIAQDSAEFDRIIKAIYSSEYQDKLTIQEFIPGEDCCMRVLNCYVDSDSQVRLMALGNPLLEEHTPNGIGSYMAIVNTVDEQLLDKFKHFLTDIGYTGFANFDMKYDHRDGSYKLFETNPRQGRSSFYVTASGYNLAKWLVEDVVDNAPYSFTIATNKVLWLQIPKGVLFKYVKDKTALATAKQLIKEDKCINSLFYDKDMNFKRYTLLQLSMLNHYRKYKKYFGKKGLNEGT